MRWQRVQEPSCFLLVEPSHSPLRFGIKRDARRFLDPLPRTCGALQYSTHESKIAIGGCSRSLPSFGPANGLNVCRRLEGRRKLIRALRLGLKPALWIAKAALAIQDKKEKA